MSDANIFEQYSVNVLTMGLGSGIIQWQEVKQMKNAELALLFGGEIANKRMEEKILSCNEVSKKYGLSLSPAQAAIFAKNINEILNKAGRIEFGEGIADRIILAFCDSPYILSENYEDFLRELADLFYHFKNETHELVSDAELISFMKSEFDGECAGSMDLLSQSLTELARHINAGKSYETFKKGR